MKKTFLLTVVLWFSMVQIGYCQEQPLQLTIKSDKQVYEVGEEIWIAVTIRNFSEKDFLLGSLGIEISSDNLEIPIYSPIRFSDNTFDNTPNKQEVISLKSKDNLVLKYNLYDLKWSHIFSSKWADKLFKEYISAGRYTLSLKMQGYPKNTTSEYEPFISNTITIELVKKISISKEEALSIAKEICGKAKWEWKDVSIEEDKDKWVVRTCSLQDGGNAYIEIDKYTGKVLNKFYDPE